MKLPMMYDTKVGVWHFPTRRFVYFVPCPGEKRVRIDVFDSLENYAVFEGHYEGKLFFAKQPARPLTGWRIDYT